MNDYIKKFLKLPYKNISEDIINSLVSNLLSNSSQYSDLEIKQIIKAFCYNKISKYYPDFNVEVIPQDIIDSKSSLNNVEGLVLDNTIYLEESVALNIKNDDIEIFRIIMHEVQHIKQRYLIDTNSISYRAFLLIMEEIVVMEMSNLYYQDNYLYLFEEIDARLESEFNLFDFLEKYSDRLLYENIDDILDNISIYEEQASNVLRQVNNKKYNREELFDKIIRKNPEYIEAYPILNFYYNVDGSKIPVARLIERKNSVPQNIDDKPLYKKIIEMDKHVIENRSGSKINVKRDIQSLINYVPQDDIELDIMERSLNDLLNSINNNYEDNIINDIYDNLVDRVEYFKNKISETKNAANTYTLKLYFMLQKASYRKRG